MKKQLSLILSFLCIAKPAIPSISSLDQAVENFMKGKELYYELSFDEAIKRLKKAQKIYHENISHLTKGDELYESHLFAALCYFSQNKIDLSNEEIRTAYLLNPKRRLDTKLYPPPFVDHTEKVMKGFKELKKVTLEIHSTPPFATVFINGFQMGLTPLILKDFPAHAHHIKIISDDFKEWNARFSPDQRPPFKINAKLVPLADPGWAMKAPLSQIDSRSNDEKMKQLISELEKENESDWSRSLVLYGALAVAAGTVGYGLLQKSKSEQKKEGAATSSGVAPSITVRLP